jgi:replicative superfamily II helicase
VVLDELHMIDDDARGYLLEILSAKLLSMGQPVQIIGMSATMAVSSMSFSSTSSVKTMLM